MQRRGRPTNYTLELALEICETIASSSRGTKQLCKENPHWPSQDTLFAWLKNHCEFSEQYRVAKQCQVEVLTGEMIFIADDDSNDIIIGKNGNLVANQASINRAKMKIDARKWLASKLAPKVYGNKITKKTQNTHLTHKQALILLAGDDYQSFM